MKKEYHQTPCLEYGGKNLEEKESRHDLDAKLVEDRDVRNAHARGCKIIPE